MGLSTAVGGVHALQDDYLAGDLMHGHSKSMHVKRREARGRVGPAGDVEFVHGRRQCVQFGERHQQPELAKSIPA